MCLCRYENYPESCSRWGYLENIFHNYASLHGEVGLLPLDHAVTQDAAALDAGVCRQPVLARGKAFEQFGLIRKPDRLDRREERILGLSLRPFGGRERGKARIAKCRRLGVGNDVGTERPLRRDTCRHEFLLAYSCKTRYFCPSCHQTRVLLYGEWVEQNVPSPVTDRHMCSRCPGFCTRSSADSVRDSRNCAVSARLLTDAYAGATPGARPGLILFVQTFGDQANFNLHLHVLTADGVFGAYGTFIALTAVPETLLAESFRGAVLEFLVNARAIPGAGHPSPPSGAHNWKRPTGHQTRSSPLPTNLSRTAVVRKGIRLVGGEHASNAFACVKCLQPRNRRAESGDECAAFSSRCRAVSTRGALACACLLGYFDIRKS